MLIEIHMLQNHAPSNLNRDDSGSPKECVFGNVKRARISSQCLKRSIRRSDIFQAEMSGHLAERTRRLPELVRERLKDAGVSDDLCKAAAKKVSEFGKKDAKTTESDEGAGPAKKTDKQRKADTPEKEEEFKTRQTMFLTQRDIDAVTQVMKSAAEKAKSVKELEGLAASELQKQAQQAGYRPLTVDIALFGRMTTSEAFRDVEAAAQVAHALSTHKVDHEYDYFTAVDDLKGVSEEEEDMGADMLGDVEYNSACYYKYFSIDLDGLIKNLTGESAHRPNISAEDRAAARDLAGRAVESLLKAAVMTTPTGKQNTFAAHQLPAAVLVEVRPYATPVSYANAFVKPAWVPPSGRAANDGDLVTDSMDKLSRHVDALTKGFNLESSARLLLTPERPDFMIDGVESVKDLSGLRERIRQVMSGGAPPSEAGTNG